MRSGTPLRAAAEDQQYLVVKISRLSDIVRGVVSRYRGGLSIGHHQNLL